MIFRKKDHKSDLGLADFTIMLDWYHRPQFCICIDWYRIFRTQVLSNSILLCRYLWEIIARYCCETICYKVVSSLDFPPVESFPGNPIQAVCFQTKHLPKRLFKVHYWGWLLKRVSILHNISNIFYTLMLTLGDPPHIKIQVFPCSFLLSFFKSFQIFPRRYIPILDGLVLFWYTQYLFSCGCRYSGSLSK